MSRTTTAPSFKSFRSRVHTHTPPTHIPRTFIHHDKLITVSASPHYVVGADNKRLNVFFYLAWQMMKYKFGNRTSLCSFLTFLHVAIDTHYTFLFLIYHICAHGRTHACLKSRPLFCHNPFTCYKLLGGLYACVCGFMGRVTTAWTKWLKLSRKKIFV